LVTLELDVEPPRRASEGTIFERTLTFAPRSMSSFAASGWLSETAHIKEVVPPQVSTALICAPLSRRTLIASGLPVREAIMSAVSPYFVNGAFGFAPALKIGRAH